MTDNEPVSLVPIPQAGTTLDGPPPPTASTVGDLPKVSGRWITMLIIAIFGVYIAYVTPVGVSLAIQVKALAPHEEYLGIILGVGAFAGLIVGPLGGQLSDRTRTRLGRRRPWVIGGTVVGVVGLIVMAASPNVLGLGVGWVNYTLLYLTAAGCTAIGGTLVLRIKSVR